MMLSRLFCFARGGAAFSPIDRFFAAASEEEKRNASSTRLLTIRMRISRFEKRRANSFVKVRPMVTGVLRGKVKKEKEQEGNGRSGERTNDEHDEKRERKTRK